MLYCSDKPPLQPLDRPLLIGLPSVGIDLQFLVGDGVAKFPGQGERPYPADRNVAEAFAEVERRGGGTAVVVVQHRSVRAVGPGTGKHHPLDTDGHQDFVFGAFT